MRTDEEILTGMALGEVPCPCQQDCPNATSALSTAFGVFRKDGVDWMVAGHDSMNFLIQCVAIWVSRFLGSWVSYNVSMRNYPNQEDLMRDLVATLKKMNDKDAQNKVFQAMQRIVRRRRMYACSSNDELRDMARLRSDVIALDLREEMKVEN